MATQDPKSGFTFCPFGEVDKRAEAILCGFFDQSVFFDEQEILNELREAKIIRKVALTKTILYPIESLFFRIVAGKEYYEFIRDEQKIYWAFLRKKITLKDFKRNLLGNYRG